MGYAVPVEDLPIPNNSVPAEDLPDQTGSLAKRRAEIYDPETGGGSYLWNELKSGIVGGTLGLAGLANDAVSFTPRIIKSLLGFTPTQFMESTTKGTQFGNELLSVDTEMKPPDALSRYAGNVAEFGGASIVPGVGIIGKAAHKVPAILAEIASIISGGVASEISGDIAEEQGVNRAWGEIPGGIFGGATGYTIPTLFSKGKAGAGSFQNAVTGSAGKEIQNIVKAEKTADKITESLDVSKKIEGVTGIPFEPTLAGRTNSPALSNLETNVLGRDITAAERAISKQTKNVENLQLFKNTLFPESAIPLQKAANIKTRGVLQNIDTAIEKLAAGKAVIAKEVTGGKQQTAGKSLDELRLIKQKEVKNALDKELDNIYKTADEVGIAENMDDVTSLVRKIVGDDENAFQSMPPVFKQIHDRYKKTEDVTPASPILDSSGSPVTPAQVKEISPEASFQELHSLYKETNRELTSARGARDQTQAYYLGLLKDHLAKKINKYEGEEFGELGAKFKNWNKKYADYAGTYKEGIAGRMSATGKYGENLSKEGVVKKFLTPTGMDNFNKIYKGDPLAKQSLEDGILDLFAKQSGIKTNGVINPKTAETFLKNHNEALQKMPELHAKLKDATKATEAIVEKNARVLAARKEIEEGIVANLAKVDDPIPLIQKALTDKKELIKLMKISQDGRTSILNMVARAIPDAAKKEGITVSEYMLKHKNVLEQALNSHSKGHYENLGTIAKAMDMLIAGRPPTHPSLTKFDVDPLQAWTGTSGPSALAQYRSTMTFGRISPEYVTSSILMRYWMKLSGEQAKRLQEYILTSPEAARDFASAANIKNSKSLSNKLSSHMIASGIRSIGSSTEEFIDENQVGVQQEDQ